MTHSKIKFAIIGCGYWGPNFMRIIMHSESAELKIVCDTDLSKLSSLSLKNPTVYFTPNIDEILHDNEIQAVVVCTPVNTHFQLTEKLLKAGKHVLCEKPLSDKVSHCEILHQLATKNNLTLMVGHVFEYNNVVLYMKKLIDQNELGELRYIQFVRMGLGPIRNDVSVLYDLASHDISLAISFLRQMPLTVIANGADFLQKGIEDVAFIQLEFPNKVLVSISVSWLDPMKQRLLKIVGENKMLLFDDVSVSEKLKIVEAGKNYQTNSGDFGSFQLSIKDGEIVIPNIYHNEPLINELDHFIGCINNNIQPLTNAMYAKNVVAVLNAAQESIKNGGIKIAIV
jgi:predicted dehydrogenase